MGWFELTVIYLAFGAPLAVHRAMGVRGGLSAREALEIGLCFFGWPGALLFFGWRRLNPNPTRPDERLRARIDHLTAELQTSIARDEFEGSGFVEALGLYVDLSLAKDHASDPPTGLFTISGHPNSELAARCSARRDSRKLAFHLLRARNDFIAAIDELAAVSTDRGATLRTSIAIVELLGDVDAAADLAAMEPIATPSQNDLKKPSVAAARR